MSLFHLRHSRTVNGRKPEVGFFSPFCHVATCSSISIFLLILLIGACYPHMAGRPRLVAMMWGCSESATIAETYDAQLEQAVTDAVRQAMRESEQRNPFQPIRRGQHARTTACLKVNFKVRPGARKAS